MTEVVAPNTSSTSSLPNPGGMLLLTPTTLISLGTAVLRAVVLVCQLIREANRQREEATVAQQTFPLSIQDNSSGEVRIEEADHL